MSVRLQEKLLRLVEYGEFERLGGQRTLQVDVRIVGATNVDLRLLAARGTFRHDLLDRLSFDVVHLPALRHRAEDIQELAQHFAVQMCAETGLGDVRGLFSCRQADPGTTPLAGKRARTEEHRGALAVPLDSPDTAWRK